jgi:site-specific DNA-cytosine methylase
MEYHASEIDEPAMKVAKHNYPSITHIGDVCDIDPYDYKDFDLIIGGSPCQSISNAGKRKGMRTNDGFYMDSLETYLHFKNDLGYNYDDYHSSRYFTTSCLFWEFVRIYRGIKKHNPNVKFLLENVVSKYWAPVISYELNVTPIKLNSSYTVPQNRERHYWTNIPINRKDFTPKGGTLSDVIPDAIAGAGYRGVPRKNWVKSPKTPCKHVQKLTVRKDGLSNCIVTRGSTNLYQNTNGDILKIKIEDVERLQTVPVGYTNVPGVSNTNRHKMLGNGWTVDVIADIFKGISQ